MNQAAVKSEELPRIEFFDTNLRLKPLLFYAPNL